MKEVVTFFLSGKEYGVEVSRMQGIENYEEMTTAADMPDCLEGIVNIRDEMIPVLDIKKRLVLPPAAVTGDTKYLVIFAKRGKLAFVADGVSRIIQVNDDDLQDFPSLMQTERTSYVDFVVKHEGHLVLAIDPEGLLTEEEWGDIENILEDRNGGKHD